ncbi:hypothetical protein Tco_0973681, partial [Tanacetum coccineum]
VQLVDTESEPEEAPSEVEELTDSFHSTTLSDSTKPLSPDHPLTHVSPTPTHTRASFHHRKARMTMHIQPAMSPGHSARVTEAMDLSNLAFRKRFNDEGHGSGDKGHGSGDEGHGSDDEGQGLEGEGLGLEEEEEEEATHEGQQQAVLVVDTIVSEPLGLGYGEARRRALESIEEIAPSTYEVDPGDNRVYTDIPVYPPVTPVQTPLSPEWSSGSLL